MALSVKSKVMRVGYSTYSFIRARKLTVTYERFPVRVTYRKLPTLPTLTQPPLFWKTPFLCGICDWKTQYQPI